VTLGSISTEGCASTFVGIGVKPLPSTPITASPWVRCALHTRLGSTLESFKPGLSTS